jgi:tetratricopeptide (TPR) repeat protein
MTTHALAHDRKPGKRAGQHAPLRPFRKLALAAFVAFSAGGPLVFSGSFRSEAREAHDSTQIYSKRGIAAYNAGNDSIAIADFSSMIRLDSGSTFAYLYRGLSHYSKKDYRAAILDYSEALRLDPYYALALRDRGSAYYAEGIYDSAIADFTREMLFDPGSPEPYNNRGLAYCSKGDADGAIIDFIEAIGLNRYHANKYALAESYNNIANAYLKRGQNGDTASAISNFSQAIGLRPGNSDFYFNRGNAYLGKGQYSGAINDFKKAMDVNPLRYTNWSVLAQLGYAYLQRGLEGDYRSAIGYYNQVIGLRPEDGDAYYNRGVARFNNKDYLNAIKDFKRSLELLPSSGGDVYFNLAIAYHHLALAHPHSGDSTLANQYKDTAARHGIDTTGLFSAAKR